MRGTGESGRRKNEGEGRGEGRAEERKRKEKGGEGERKGEGGDRGVGGWGGTDSAGAVAAHSSVSVAAWGGSSSRDSTASTAGRIRPRTTRGTCTRRRTPSLWCLMTASPSASACRRVLTRDSLQLPLGNAALIPTSCPGPSSRDMARVPESPCGPASASMAAVQTVQQRASVPGPDGLGVEGEGEVSHLTVEEAACQGCVHHLIRPAHPLRQGVVGRHTAVHAPSGWTVCARVCRVTCDRWHCQPGQRVGCIALSLLGWR